MKPMVEKYTAETRYKGAEADSLSAFKHILIVKIHIEGCCSVRAKYGHHTGRGQVFTAIALCSSC